jgi:hypothetical protein
MWKSLQTAALLIAVMVGAGLLVSSYFNLRHSAPPPTASVTYAFCQGPDGVQSEDVARVVINAQEIAEVGELVRFDLTESTAESFKWILVPEAVDFEVYCDGQRAVFSARKPGSYMFIIGCAYEGTVDVAVHIVTVEGNDPPNILRPNVNASLDKWVPYWCSVNTLPKDEADKLAGSFEGVAAQIAADVLQEAEDIIKATSDANKQALGDSLSDWLPVLRELQTTMKTLAGQGKLTTPDQHQALWGEIAKGLRYYAAQF